MSGAEPVYRCFTKAIEAAGPPKRGANWAAARRAWFRVYDDRIECGDWLVRFADVQSATAWRTRSLMVPCTVLELVTDERTLQFAFNPWARPLEYLPFSMLERQVSLGWSPISIIARVLLVAWVLWVLLS
jgi:hypothetical protein